MRRRTFASATVLATAAILVRPIAEANARRLMRSWNARVAIAGRSMEPLVEDGDWLLVDPDAYRARPVLPGDLVLAPDPREPARLLLKRVSATTVDGRLELAGDAPDQSTDSRTFGAIDPATVLGRPWLRYWPPRRASRIR
jgi:nickel-type superoxide dismutase maturation protease